MARQRRLHPRSQSFLFLGAVALLAVGLSSAAPEGTAGAPLGLPAFGAAGPNAPLRLCSSSSPLMLSPYTKAPRGAITVPAGDDSVLQMSDGGVIIHNFELTSHRTYWFAPGTHTLGTGLYNQIEPDADDAFIGAPGAVLDGQGDNEAAFAQEEPNVTIEYLTIENFVAGVGQSAVNHDSGPDWTLKYDTITGTTVGAAAAIGDHDVYEYNCLADNGEYGLNGGGTGGVFSYNEVVANGAYYANAHANLCTGCSGGIKYWAAKDVVVEYNYIHNNYGPGLWFDTNNQGALVQGNYISANDGNGLIYEISYNALIQDNTFVDNGWSASEEANANIVGEALYIFQSGGSEAVSSEYQGTLMVQGNTFVDNWDGLVIYQDADRICSNNSTDDCTLADPSVFTNSSCSQYSAASSPNSNPDYYDGCQWKPQNITVAGNVFYFNPAAIAAAKPYFSDEDPSHCPATGLLDTSAGNMYYCGFNGMYAFEGSHPPVGGTSVAENAIMNLPNPNGEAPDNNHWLDNTYFGPWVFQAYSQSPSPQNGHETEIPFDVWRSAWSQDIGSTISPAPQLSPVP
ncbi:MAG TPA: right-handed parallel beta-helix repeat-containing protein [Acidimicrobiales bacterium]|nr:right-handed parallel beta-helix repeat-containing protein [Acidimicrobiales bacterium]